ncbi:MAG TPA: type II toxin-antitoxin system RelE/ParE family toxin [Candidatus Babeliales bacterium]|nr:type II toxin-antitoxin system RelE/ParE family toxin [Candidatus Babeliales bacterium]
MEWYYDNKGYSQAHEYYKKLSKEQQEKLTYLLFMLGDTGQIRNEEKFRNENDQIYAFKPKPDRFLCFFYHGKKVIVTNAFVKKQQKLPPVEKAKALKSRVDYIKRVLGGNYYD